ncbi:kinesin-domain-containing protein [Pholiota conissans]|uniref:Kinesin-like protein n=1 Tax=Pholiota conissans TaxID=109636 RepID=A0A9P5Z9Y5_9AGAR|nr:kinesin-domain-containing protein [Pholiota conissans]
MSFSRNTTVPSTPNSSLSKAGRPAPFTPKRPLSAQSNSSSTSTATSTSSSADQLAARLSRVNTPILLNSTHKKYKAPLSIESRSKTNTSFKPRSTLAPVPGTPTKKDGSHSRPRTPNTPRSRSGAESPCLMPSTSEMDVSNVDPEQVLVDSQTVEAGDVSGDIDEAWLKSLKQDHGREDKVMVSIRVRPTDLVSAWIPNTTANSLNLDPNFAKNTTSSTTGASSFNFDAVLTGTPNKPIYTTVARSHVQAAMEGYNAVIFAYGQTASGKTFTLSGDDAEPGIIPRAMRDVFGFIKRTPEREYLLRCSYLEIYNEAIIDLLAPPMMAKASPVQIQGGAGGDVILAPLREEVVTSLKGVKEVMRRGEGNRRTACTDWNERSSRSHSVFRLVIESRERGSSNDSDDEDDEPVVSPPMNGRHTPGLNGRQTPGLSGRQTPGLGRSQTPGPGGPKLQARGGRSVQTSVLSLIDLAGSEKATSDKERTREGKYINTSLLTLGTVIGTLADNAAKKKADHVPYRNSKLTRMLQPSLSGNARISVICTINPDPGAVSESMSTLLFAKRIKNVQLNAKKKEVVDTDALIERYRKEIEELKARLAEREAEVPVRNRRLSAREQIDESKAMRDLNGRIQQLTKLILTSATVDENKEGDSESRPASPVKIDFDMSPYQLQQELLAARLQIESQANQILSLEASLLARPPLPVDAPSDEKDKLIAEQTKTIRELEIVVRGYEENLGEPLRQVKEDVEKEWSEKLDEERKRSEKSEKWAEEVVKALEKEKKARQALEEERRALAAFVSKFDSLGLSLSAPPSKLRPPMPTPGGAMTAYERRQSRPFSSNAARLPRISDVTVTQDFTGVSQDLTGFSESSPMRFDRTAVRSEPSLFDQAMLEEMGSVDVSFDEIEVERQLLEMSVCVQPGGASAAKMFSGLEKPGFPKSRDVFVDKENILP